MARQRRLRVGLITGGLAVAVALSALGAGSLARQRAPDGASPQSPPTAPSPAQSPPSTAAPPTPTSSPAPDPTAAATPTPTPTPSATRTLPPVGQPLDVGDLAEQVSAIRGLAVGPPIQARALTSDELQEAVRSLGFGWGEGEDLEASARLLTALRLIPPGFDLSGQGVELYTEQVVGVYSIEHQTLLVRGAPGELTPYAEFIAAHEITHALQDRAFDLRSLRDLPATEADAATALLALIEGDAVLTQREWSARHQTEAERAALRRESASGSNAVLGTTPAYLRAVLQFPYREGVAFVSALTRQDGYSAVDKAYANPPTTTEQIMHPDKYLAGEPAVPVMLGGAPDPVPERQRSAAFGQFDLRELLRPLGVARAERAAIGWGGGEIGWWWTGEDTAVAIALAFDTIADGEDACAAVPEWYRAVADGAAQSDEERLLRGDRDWMAYRCEAERVWVGLAPDADQAQRLAGAGVDAPS